MIATLRKSVGATLMVILSALAWSGCGGDDAPVPGTITVSLASPNSDDGAVVFSLSGTGIGGLQPASTNYQVFQRLITASEFRIAVFGNVAAGPILTASVPDIRDASAYVGIVIQVASRSNELRLNSGYAITIETSAASSASRSTLLEP